MNYKKSFNFLKKLPAKLNSFYIKKSKLSVKVKNKSKSKKNFDPVTNFDRAWVINQDVELNNICEECKKGDESVKQNLIMHSYKICNSCNLAKTIFPL